MGWFDDDSDSDDSRKRKLPLFETFEKTEHLCRNASSGDRDVALCDDPVKQPIETLNVEENRTNGSRPEQSVKEDDSMLWEDPLDSYMNQLSSATSVEKVSVKNRLDVENEEEATAHWKTTTQTPIQESSTAKAEKIDARSQPYEEDLFPGRQDNDHDTGYHHSYESMKARASMAQTFHKAGEGPTLKKHKTEEMILNDSDSWEEEKLKRTIEPLESINHSSIDYAPFRKKFLEPKRSSRGSSWRSEHDVSCSEDVDPIVLFSQYDEPSTQSDNTMIFPKEVLSYLNHHNLHQATAVQAQSIPAALAGYDLLVTSQTGSGKTLAYILPLVPHILDQPRIVANVDGPIAIVLTPTRELARQVYVVAKKVFGVVGCKVCAVTGGSGTYEMSKELKKGCELIVSTPGRFIDMVKRKATNCKRITFVVLDEADKMLDMGFENQCASILNHVRPDRQTVMFSATFGKKVERAAKGWLRHPVRIAVGRTGFSSEHVDQHIMVLPSDEAKRVWLKEMLPTLTSVGKTMIFVASRADCDVVAHEISGMGVPVDSIHGDKHQIDRNAAISSLRKGTISALVATDVASRGLDVTDVMNVINFDPAKNIDSHVHRIGRAGRLSKSASNQEKHQRGTAYTLLTPKNADFANSLMEAFQREGREVTDELYKLASNSRHFGGGGRQRWDRSGLGYGGRNEVKNIPLEPQKKRSRWGH